MSSKQRGFNRDSRRDWNTFPLFLPSPSSLFNIRLIPLEFKFRSTWISIRFCIGFRGWPGSDFISSFRFYSRICDETKQAFMKILCNVVSCEYISFFFFFCVSSRSGFEEFFFFLASMKFLFFLYIFSKMTGSIINEWGKIGETRYHFPFFILF